MTLLLRPEAPNWPVGGDPRRARRHDDSSASLHAIVITKAGVPSFVVTLAGLLIWSGVVLIMTTQYTTSGTIKIQDHTVIGIANDFLSPFWGWIGRGRRGGGLCALQLQTARSRRAGGLFAKPGS